MNDVEKFYDEFSDKQIKTGLNRRHHSIVKKTADFISPKTKTFLEIGCGIGVISEQIARKYKHLKVRGIDISPKSIDIATARTSDLENITFNALAVQDLPLDRTFDVVLLPDVLEHIPIEEHASIFENIHRISHPNSEILIHIPNPFKVDSLRKTQPESLQIIDQSLWDASFFPNIFSAGFFIYQLSCYPLFERPFDYTWISLKRNDLEITFDKGSKLDQVKKEIAYKYF